MFTTSAIILQIAFACVLAAALFSQDWRARLLIGIAAALIGWQSYSVGHDIVTTGWMAAIVLVCLFLAGRHLVERSAITFSSEEAGMRAAIFDTIAARDVRHLIDQGWWLNGAAGDTLARQGEPVDAIVFIATGSAHVLVDGRQVATCEAGELVGEATALTGEPATATVLLASPARLWCAKADTLRHYIAAHPKVAAALERSFRNSLRTKLVASNRRMAETGGGQ